MLLLLPPEILDGILTCLDPPDFALFVATSKKVRSRILANPTAIHRQLRAVPHLHLCQELKCKASSGESLLRKFHEQAARQRLNGIAVTCDIARYEPDYQPRSKLTQLQHFTDLAGAEELVAVPRRDASLVYVYAIYERHPVLRFIVQPEVSFVSLADYEIVLLKLHQGDAGRLITILYRHVADKGSTSQGAFQNSFTLDARRFNARTMLLVTCSLSSSDGVVLQQVRQIKTRTHTTPVAMECSASGVVVIAVRNYYAYQIMVFAATDQDYDYDPEHHLINGDTELALSSDSTMRHLFKSDHPIYSLLLCKTSLYVCPSATGMPIYVVANYTDHGSPIESLSQKASATSESFFGAYRWMPLAVSHKHRCVQDDSGAWCCVSSVLQLTQTQCRIYEGNQFSTMAYSLVKGSLSSEACDEIDLQRPLPNMEHEIVGVLDGPLETGSISHGHVIATSKKGNCIAIAIWDRIFIFMVDTKAFLQQRSGSLPSINGTGVQKVSKRSRHFAQKGREFAQKDDPTYSKNTGLGYYRDTVRLDTQRGRHIAILRPIELPPQGVVHKLRFVAKNTLWAWTDRGLVKWDWDKKRRRESHPSQCLYPSKTGQRRVCTLPNELPAHVTVGAPGRDYDVQKDLSQNAWHDLMSDLEENPGSD